ncbi:MAG TPA: hypothetical protein VK619_12025 [Pyrinomonadaceae bacterium]|nr:hypothetical protein [Pyrinomonadaceae bacterium]
MKSWTKRIALAVLLMAASVPAMADVPNPNGHGTSRSSNIKTFMHLSPDVRATEAKLIIPRSLLTELSAQADGHDSQSAAAVTRRIFNMNGAQTVMAGIFLSLAFAAGGLWLVRSRVASGKPARAALGVALLALCGATAGVTYANAGPPPVARSLTSRILIQDAQPYGASGEVKVEVSDDANTVTLVLPVKNTQ